MMQTSSSIVACSSRSKDYDAPPSVPRAVDVLDTCRDDVCSENRQCLMGYNELHEIFSWMPAKSVIKYSSSLCKSLCDIHLDPHFIKKQCIHACIQDKGFILKQPIEGNDEDPIGTYIEFHVPPGHTRSTFGTPWESQALLPKYGYILSSSNGLLLMGIRTETSWFANDYKFWVCNPATREWAHLPTPEGFTFHINISINALIECYPHATFDDGVEFPNDYTIALPVVSKPSNVAKPTAVGYFNNNWYDNNKLELLIYCNGRWEEECCDVSVENRLLRYDYPVAVYSTITKGVVVHYLCDSGNDIKDRLLALGRIRIWTNNGPEVRYYDEIIGDKAPNTVSPEEVYLEPYIAAFDLGMKKLSREIKLPEGAWDADLDDYMGKSLGNLLIFKWKDAGICLVRCLPAERGRVEHERFTVWVLEDAIETSSSWRLLMDRVITREMAYGNNSNKRFRISRFGVLSGRGLLLATRHEVFLYVVEGEGQGKLELLRENESYAWSMQFVAYANTLRPVCVSGSDTYVY